MSSELPFTFELWRYAWEMMERRIKGAGRKVAPGAEGVELATSTKEAEKKSRKEVRRGAHKIE
jgi:hypothetical protein